MATCCSVLAWRISGYSPWSPRVSRDGVTNRVHFRSKQPMRGNGGCKVQPLGKKVRWKEGAGAEAVQMLGPGSRGPGLPLTCLDEAR